MFLSDISIAKRVKLHNCMIRLAMGVLGELNISEVVSGLLIKFVTRGSNCQ